MPPPAHTTTSTKLNPPNDKAARAAQNAKQLRLAIAKCWTLDPSLPADAAAKSVQIDFVIKQSGDVVGSPRIVNRRGEPTPLALAQTAVRAIQTCAPYANLPTDAFDRGLLQMRMTFDARGL